jgi:hypothetical protein
LLVLREGSAASLAHLSNQGKAKGAAQNYLTKLSEKKTIAAKGTKDTEKCRVC